MIYVLKAAGEKEAYDEEKIRQSIRRAGAPPDLEDRAIQHIKTKLYSDISTAEIYQHVTEFLEKSPRPFITSKYSLKKAIMELGPTGYPFEDFLAEIFKTQDYITEVRSIIAGKCIKHEIDVTLQKDSHRIMIEAKYHNMPGTKTNVHVALYTKARFDDVKEINGFSNVWLVTNTKVSTDVIAYADCVGMKVISWNYPEGESLRDLIEKSNLIPITALTTLSQGQKQQLLQNGIVLCKTLCQRKDLIKTMHLPEDKINSTLAECTYLSATQ